MKRILIADSDAESRSLIAKYAHFEGYSTSETGDGKTAILMCRQNPFNIVILDTTISGMEDGISVLKTIRTFSQVPIIFLTGKDGEENKLTGFTLGAEDYIVKPYSLRELKARIDVVLRRYGNTASPAASSLNFGNLLIDKLAHKAYFNGEDLGLANREYEVLLFLAEHPNREVTFEELGIALFGVYQEIDRRSVIVNVSRLRKKFEGNYELENMIETVWSKGYRFIPK